MSVRLTLSLSAVLVLATSHPAHAQTCSVNAGAGSCPIAISVQTTAPKVVRLTVNPASITLTSPSATDFDNGYAATTGPVVTVSANTPWTVSMRAGAALWMATTTVPGVPARANKPSTDLQWSTAAGGTFTGFITTDVTLASGTRTNAAATSLYYRTLYSWTADTPGNYSLPVILTVVAP